jgi:hypothetical protein
MCRPECLGLWALVGNHSLGMGHGIYGSRPLDYPIAVSARQQRVWSTQVTASAWTALGRSRERSSRVGRRSLSTSGSGPSLSAV